MCVNKARQELGAAKAVYEQCTIALITAHEDEQ